MTCASTRNATFLGLRRSRRGRSSAPAPVGPREPEALGTSDDTERGRVSKSAYRGDPRRPGNDWPSSPWPGSWPCPSAAPDPAANSVLLPPHGGPPTIYAGPGNRVAVQRAVALSQGLREPRLRQGLADGQVRRRRARAHAVRPRRDEDQRTPGACSRSAAASAGTARRSTCRPTAPTRSASSPSTTARGSTSTASSRASTRASTCRSRSARPLKAGTRHSLVVRADWRGPTRMKHDGWHRLWFNFGGINRGVSIRRIGDSEISHPAMNTKLADGAAIIDMKVHLRNNGDPPRARRQGRARARRPARRDRVPARAARDQGGTEVLRRRCASTTRTCGRRRRRTSGSSSSRCPGESTYRARVGLREVRADGADLLLNGKPIRLRGASIHEDVVRARRRAAADRPGPPRRATSRRSTRTRRARSTRSTRACSSASTPPASWSGRASGPTDAPGAWTSRGAERVRDGADRVRTNVRQGQLHPSIITWNLANEVAGKGHPEGQIPYIDGMAAGARQDRSQPPGRARHLGRPRAAASRRGSTATST